MGQAGATWCKCPEAPLNFFRLWARCEKVHLCTMALRHASQRPFVVGVTGGIAAGKSTVCRMLSSMGVAVWDADRAAKSLYRTDHGLRDDVVGHFGEEVALRDDQGATMDIDRSALAGKVFGTPRRTRLVGIESSPCGGPCIRHLARRSTGTHLGGARGGHLVRVWQRPRLRRRGDCGSACGVARSACPSSWRLVRGRRATHERPMALRRPNCPRPRDHLERRCATFAATSGATVRHRRTLGRVARSSGLNLPGVVSLVG